MQMESNTQEQAVTVSLTDRGLTTKTYRRVRLEAFAAELEALKGKPWLWSPHTWHDDKRGKGNWEAASCIALDLDYSDADGTHTATPADAVERYAAALRELPPVLAAGEVLSHHTPRGARLVLLLDAPITDRELYARAATAAGEQVTWWLEASGLRGQTGRAGYALDEGALLDLARVLWTPNATKVDPNTGAREVRTGTFVVRGAAGVRFVASQLAALAPASTVPEAVPSTDHAPHPLWPSLEAALLATPKARKVEGKGVEVCCPVHDDDDPSAIVFASGMLFCQSSGCDANKGKPLDAWAGAHGAELLGETLARAVGPRPDGRVRGETLRPLWRTVGEWGWTRTPPMPMRWLLTVPPTPAFRETRHVLARGVVGMLAAGGGVGKSMALMQLAVAVATDTAWLLGETEGVFPGFLTHGEGGKVLLALGEENAAKAHRRMDTLTAHLTPEQRELLEERLVVLPLEAVPVGLMADRNARAGEEARAGDVADELERLLMEGGPWALVVLDPLSRFAGMETEVDNAAATRFVQVLERFTKAPGEPTVLVSHHTGQAARREGMHDATAARGATALTDGARWVAQLTRERPDDDADDKATPMLKMSVSKNNYGMELWPFWLTRGDGGALRCATQREVEAFTKKNAPQKRLAAASGAKWGEP